MKRWVIGIFAGLVVFLIVFRSIQLFMKDGGSGGPGNQRPAVAVEVADVRFGPIEEIRKFTGTVHPYNQYVVAPKVSGRVIYLDKRIGDPVHEGELIARIDDAEYQQALREAEANMKIAEASLAESRTQVDLARQEKERVRSLEEKGLVTAAELDAANSNFESREARYRLALAQVEQREAALASAKIRLGYTSLNASGAGFIGERFVDEGALLAPNMAVALVVGIDSVIVRTTITERDYGYIDRGQSVDVLVDAFQGRRFSGTVARIAPMMQEASRMAEMEVEVFNASHMLKPGMFARIEVMTARKDSTQLVPGTAVVERQGKTGIFVVPDEETVARYVHVTTGIVTAETAEILDPLIHGRVVTLGQHLLDDGSPVMLREEDKDPSSDSDSSEGEKKE
ncbi:MAG: efflux RND transporter periplasmic adaptor subunit [Candidatus Krumholzibacteriota bacterium]|nr:efflux RND transporter periplasmic adaptor subunit [Candidatus Krumholzibacteriota bacterium]